MDNFDFLHADMHAGRNLRFLFGLVCGGIFLTCTKSQKGHLDCVLGLVVSKKVE